LAETSSNSHIESDLYKAYLKSGGTPIEVKQGYDGVNANERNVWKSLGRMFDKPVVSWSEEKMKRAIRITERQMGSIFGSGVQFEPEITEEAVPGAWWKYYHFRTKAEVLRCPQFYESWQQCRDGITEYPPYVTAGKREFLSKSELDEDKIRTFLMAPLELLMDEKFLYGGQDELMKQLQPGWIRYGMNMHEGGFDRFVKNTISDFHVEWDISGWDRKLPILNLVMAMRNRALEKAVGPLMWEEIKDIAKRVTDQVVNHRVLLPDGTVVKWPWSQMSGDGMTTSNNCLAHSIIAAYLLISACPEATDDEIVDQLVNLYGDDIFAGLKGKFSKLKEEKFVNSVYMEFGMSVKKGTFKCQETPVNMSFLGATVKAFRMGKQVFFSPGYKRDRILTGVKWSLSPLNGDEELMKMFSLLELGWYDCYDEIRMYIEYLFRVLPVSAVKNSFLRRGIPSRVQIRNTWAGVFGVD